MDFRTTSLCDANEKEIGLTIQISNPVFKHFGRRYAFHGQIVTLKLFEDNVLLREAASEPGQGRVLVVDVGATSHCGVIGDMIAELAHLNDWQGVVLNGYVRDSVALGKVDIGVYALGTYPQRSGKKGLGERDVPVTFWGINYKPGDYLYCDKDGLMVSAHPLLGEVAAGSSFHQ